MRCQTVPWSLAPLLLSLTSAHSALAEAPGQVPYVNRATGECGLHRTSGANYERRPLDPGFGPLGLPWQPKACQHLLDKVLAYPEVLRTPSMDHLGETATKPPCERLALSLPSSVEHTCKALGYRYVGELPASTRPCYPHLAPFLGASCAPLIWIHLATLIVLVSSLGTLVYVLLERRQGRRRALAAANANANTNTH